MRKKIEFRRIAIVGAGMMGHGIAIAFARGGYHVSLIDAEEKGLRRGLEWVAQGLAVLVEMEVIGAAESRLIAERVVGTTDLRSGVESADFVVEAVPDVLEAKRQLFMNLEEFCSAGTIFATTTASFRASEIASALIHRERVLGAHWVNPPHIMPLVEVAATDETSEENLEATLDLLRGIGKKPIRCKDIPGLINNRLLFALLNEGLKILEMGAASAEDIDDAIRFGFGSRVLFYGPFRWNDFFGNLPQLKTAYESLYAATGEEAFRPSPQLQRQIETQRLGFGAGKGWYDYPEAAPEMLGPKRTQMLRELADWYKQKNLL
jgi:3-hydroxybutyryl-CoA dehydrogenase